jgi:hypothetical protein
MDLEKLAMLEKVGTARIHRHFDWIPDCWIRNG